MYLYVRKYTTALANIKWTPGMWMVLLSHLIHTLALGRSPSFIPTLQTGKLRFRESSILRQGALLQAPYLTEPLALKRLPWNFLSLVVSNATLSKTSEPKSDWLGPLPGLSFSLGCSQTLLPMVGLTRCPPKLQHWNLMSGLWPHHQPWSHPLTGVSLGCQNHADMPILTGSNYLGRSPTKNNFFPQSPVTPKPCLEK